MTADSYDVVVVGMGPSGSALACYLADAGLSVLGLEREKFPRYRIGESLTGIAGDRIAELGLESKMAEIGAPDQIFGDPQQEETRQFLSSVR